MFGRKKTAETPATTRSAGQAEGEDADRIGGKGRPTPTRREAQEAAKARARGTMDKKQAQKVLREQRAASSRQLREGMRRGDERYLMERDKGPVRRFIRDWVDVRVSFMEFLLPTLVVIMALQLSGVRGLQSFSNGLWFASIMLLLVETSWVMMRLGRELAVRFPDQNRRGWRFYAIMRAIQLRMLRMPKPRVKVREELPTTYR